MDNEKENDLNLSGLTATLKLIQQQNARILKYQEESYKLQIQHHNNLKKVMSALNTLASKINEKQPVESKQIKQKNFHDTVMSFNKNPYSGELSEILLSITSDQFDQLKPESMEVILPILGSLIQSKSNSNKRKLAMAILWEAKTRFENVFLSPFAAVHAKVFLTTIKNLINDIKDGKTTVEDMMDYSGVTYDELIELRNFFMNVY